MRPDGVRGGLGAGPPEAQLLVQLGQVGADAGAELDLLCLELGHQVPGFGVVVDEAAVGEVVRGNVLPLAAAGRHLERLGSLRHRDAGGIDHQQFFLDPDGAHDAMITSSRAGR